jgi:hypothetical protein
MTKRKTIDLSAVKTVSFDLGDLLPAELAEHITLGVPIEETGAFVGDAGAIAWQAGRCFVCFKPPGVARNLLSELVLTATPYLVAIGYTPAPAGKTYYKDGGVSMCFGTAGELWVANTCSDDPATGAAARYVFWPTGIFCPIPAGTATVDNYARQQIMALDARLDKIAAGAVG